MAYDQLKLENQLCFPIYAASRLITRQYQTFLDELGITYPQYLVLMVLWETDAVSVNEISKKLILETNTVTPLLKRMESQSLIRRERSQTDERKVIISLTEKGKQLQSDAAHIPFTLGEKILCESISMEDVVFLKQKLTSLLGYLTVEQSN